MAKFIRGSSLLGRAKAKKQVFVNGGVGSFTAIGDRNDDFPKVQEQELHSFLFVLPYQEKDRTESSLVTNSLKFPGHSRTEDIGKDHILYPNGM